MSFKSPLKTRLILSFVLLTFIVSGIFSVAIVSVFNYTEAQLNLHELQEKIHAFSKLDSHTDKYILNDIGTEYFAEGSGRPIPPRFAAVKQGFSEFKDKGNWVFAYRETINGIDYLVVMDESLVEAYETSLLYCVCAGFLLSLWASALVGVFLSKRIISPIQQLSGEVLAQQVDLLSVELPKPLAQHYAADEVGQLARSFDATFLQLNQALLRERFFTSDVSHELRTALMVVSSSSEILLGKFSAGSKEYAHALKIHRSSMVMQNIVQTFLILARAKQNESDMSPKITLRQAALNQLAQWDEMFRTKGLVLELAEEEYQASMQAGINDASTYNASFLETVISNLLRNALMYAESGTVRMIIDKDQVSIEDTGPGISEETQSKIFEPFFRGVNDTGEGIGLGLSMVQRICRHQGWDITVRSLQPIGTSFTVLLKTNVNFTQT